MKKIKSVITLCAMVLVLCGCSAKTEYNMEIKKDQSMDFSVVMAMDEELINGMLSMEDETGGQSEYTDDQIWTLLDSSTPSKEEAEAAGFKKEKYENGNYKGYKYVKTISNIDDVTGDKVTFKLDEFS